MTEENGAGRPPARGGEVSPARQRTLSHLEKLLRTATAASAGIALVCGSDTACQSPQVCDPLPPPVDCCNDPQRFFLRGCIDHQTQWQQRGKEWVLRLSLWDHLVPGTGVVSFEPLKKEDVKVTGGTLRDFQKEPKKVTLLLVPGEGRKSVEVELSLMCNEKAIPLKLSLDVSEGPRMSGAVPVKALR